MKIFLDYIHEMYYYLLSMSDDDLDDFYINDESCRTKLFNAMKADFDTYGPESKQRVLEAIEFILSSGDIEGYWRAVVPHAAPLDEVEDKPSYLRELYKKLTGREPPLRDFGPDVQLVDAIGPNGIDVRL
ncbi:hypothetical protein EH244_30260 [Variovorax beijingensis]|uniref:CdiI immunity protein domain-containing protein n=1 Tax=Variovorax beijingensis TaxID=2496117 RepID=A0A3P3E301_9BURK|nr:hypothetical protein [Variovorax beijingensis]RRH80719.1 hypothetical protein EH244_30260 [Variovorax beijingensis]